MRVAVVGLGKIGLPLAAQFADKGHVVVGVDVNSRTVAAVNAGEEPFPGEAGLGERLGRLSANGGLCATTAFAEAIPAADVVVVVVPLFVDAGDQPDFGWLDSATAEIAANLTPDTLVLYETTLPVGTTRNRWKPALETGSGLQEGTAFHLAFSPERVLTGRVFEDLRKYPKLIGALSSAGADAARSFYEQALDFDDRPDLGRANGVWDLGSAEAAEMAKLAETTYRDVNIGLANQFTLFAARSGIDIYAVIEACNSQPFSHIHRPGISVGGHCIPVYPKLYLSNAPESTIVSAAREVNEAMPSAAVQTLVDYLPNIASAHVVILGATYRAGVKETAFSGVFPLRQRLEECGARVSVLDPYFDAQELAELKLTAYRTGDAVDAAVLHTDHEEFNNLTPDDLPGVTVVLNGRNALLTGLAETNVTVLALGRPFERSS